MMRWQHQSNALGDSVTLFRGSECNFDGTDKVSGDVSSLFIVLL